MSEPADLHPIPFKCLLVFPLYKTQQQQELRRILQREEVTTFVGKQINKHLAHTWYGTQEAT